MSKNVMLTMTSKELSDLIAAETIKTLNMLFRTGQFDFDETKVSMYTTNIPGMKEEVVTSVMVSDVRMKAYQRNGFHLRN